MQAGAKPPFGWSGKAACDIVRSGKHGREQRQMGIDMWSLQFLIEARNRIGSFGSLLQIGRQELHISKNDHPMADRYLHEGGVGLTYRQATRGGSYADEGLFQSLGATDVAAADASAYEGAVLVHDFNDPIEVRWHQRYDTVFDGGSLEHIFNVPTTLANEMNLVRVGGHILSAVPSNNWLGHGFYQFSPELPYRVFTPNNGFRMECAFLTEMTGDHSLYLVEDLARRAGGEIGCTNTNTNLQFIATKTAHILPFRRWPQQGDYQNAWDEFASNEAALPVDVPASPVAARRSVFQKLFG
ncbi:MAG TPA: hypothetical protein VF649_01585 [Sphingomonas sp.]|uniref:hypothetical protein n=1 Tax=Sphingomonas sp. TaxID=28214 RepID=UPI002EDA5CC9